MPRTYCPECDAVINVDQPREGAVLECPQCNEELEIISTDPFDVDYPLDDEDHWEDKWEDEDWEDED